MVSVNVESSWGSFVFSELPSSMWFHHSVHGQQLVLVKTFNYIKIVKRFAGDGIALFEDYC